MRTPSISHSVAVDPLSLRGKLGDYFFLTAYKRDVKNEYGMPEEQSFIYNLKNDSIHSPKYFSLGFRFFQKNAGQETVFCSDFQDMSLFSNGALKKHYTDKNILIQPFDPQFLIDNYKEKDNFSEKYKAMIANLKEDDNPVLVRIKGEVDLQTY